MGLLSLGLLSYSCANGDTVSGNTGNGTGNGGSNSTGTGGSSSTGTGGTHTGGVTGTGGTHTGGSTGTGGIITTGTGGTHTGGVTGTGGISSTGGITGTGGIVTTGTGGTMTTTCGSAFDVGTNGFVTTPAKGGACWSGYAFAGGDTGSTITPKDFSTCGAPCALTMTGTVGPATMANNYAGTAYLGFSIGQTASGTPTAVAPTGTGISVAFKNSSNSTLPLRVQLNADSTGTSFWCFTITGASPAMVPYSSFNSACWDNSGTAYAKTPIQAIELSIPGVATAEPVNVTLTSVTEY